MAEKFDRYKVIDPVEGCFVCEHPGGVPIPVGEFPAGGDIGLCTRHWTWWMMHFAFQMEDDDDPPCNAHLLAADVETTKEGNGA